MTQPQRLLLIAPPTMVSTIAFSRAAALARSLNASLRIVAFVPHDELGTAEEQREARKYGVHRSPLWSFQNWLISESSKLRVNGLQVCAEVLWNNRTVDTLCYYINEVEADYVLKDMDEAPSTSGVTFSALDWQLLQASPVPVFLIKGSESTGGHKIAAVVDIAHDTPRARRQNQSILDSAQQLVKASGGTLHLLSIYDLDELPVSEGDGLNVPTLLTCDQARQRFNAIAQNHGVEKEHRIFLTTASTSPISASVARCAYDTLVIGEGNQTVTDLLLGRSVNRILGSAPGSLLLLKNIDRVIPQRALYTSDRALQFG